MKRNQTFHETFIPLLVQCIGAKSYLEFGTHLNETIGKVRCSKRFGVDLEPRSLPVIDERSGISFIMNDGTKFFRMTTQHFINNHAERLGPFDFVFIDADHTAYAVREDFHGIWPYVSEDGLVCLHDTNPENEADTAPGFCGDSWRFAKELTRDKRYECVTLPYHPGLTIIRKRSLWGPA